MLSTVEQTFQLFSNQIFPDDLNLVKEYVWLCVRCRDRGDMVIPQWISRSLWKTRNPQICMNGGFYGQHSFRNTPLNLIRVQFGISQASDILLVWGSFIHQERRKGILFVCWNLTTTLFSIFPLSLYLLTRLRIKMDVFA